MAADSEVDPKVAADSEVDPKVAADSEVDPKASIGEVRATLGTAAGAVSVVWKPAATAGCAVLIVTLPAGVVGGTIAMPCVHGSSIVREGRVTVWRHGRFVGGGNLGRVRGAQLRARSGAVEFEVRQSGQYVFERCST